MSFFRRRAGKLPEGIRFVEKYRLTRLETGTEPTLVFQVYVDGKWEQFAIHQGMGWQMVRSFRKTIGFSPSELEAAEHYGRYVGGDGA